MQQLESDFTGTNIFARQVTFQWAKGSYFIEADLEVTEEDTTLTSLAVYNANGQKVDPQVAGIELDAVVRAYEIEEEMKAEGGMWDE